MKRFFYKSLHINQPVNHIDYEYVQMHLMQKGWNVNNAEVGVTWQQQKQQ